MILDCTLTYALWIPVRLSDAQVSTVCGEKTRCFTVWSPPLCLPRWLVYCSHLETVSSHMTNARSSVWRCTGHSRGRPLALVPQLTILLHWALDALLLQGKEDSWHGFQSLTCVCLGMSFPVQSIPYSFYVSEITYSSNTLRNPLFLSLWRYRFFKLSFLLFIAISCVLRLPSWNRKHLLLLLRGEKRIRSVN